MILSRLKKAIREQNWFAVVLEFLIVVLGVVIGFQISAWGESRADRAQEQSYLRQLAEDLRETEGIVAEADSAIEAAEYATYRLHHSFYEPNPPPRDSVLGLVVQAYTFQSIRPVTGTATALITSGDMNVIRNDDLRTAITAYYDEMERFVDNQQYFFERWFDAMDIVSSQVDGADFAEEIRRAYGTGTIPDSVFALMVPQRERVRPFAFDHEAFLASSRTNRAVFEVVVQIRNMEVYREQMTGRSSALREQIEAELNR